MKTREQILETVVYHRLNGTAPSPLYMFNGNVRDVEYPCLFFEDENPLTGANAFENRREELRDEITNAKKLREDTIKERNQEIEELHNRISLNEDRFFFLEMEELDDLTPDQDAKLEELDELITDDKNIRAKLMWDDICFDLSWENANGKTLLLEGSEPHIDSLENELAALTDAEESYYEAYTAAEKEGHDEEDCQTLANRVSKMNNYSLPVWHGGEET